MPAWLLAWVTPIVEHWVVQGVVSGVSAAYSWVKSVIYRHKQQENLEANKSNLQNAIKTGDTNAIRQADEAALNNSPPAP